MVILPDTCSRRDLADGNVLGVLRGAYPLPGVRDFGAVEVARLGLKNGCACGDDRHNLFPLVGAHYRHARNVVGVLLQKPHLLPTRSPDGAVHLRKVGENADGLVLALDNQDFELRLKRLDVLDRQLADNLEPQYSSKALLESFNHGAPSVSRSG